MGPILLLQGSQSKSPFLGGLSPLPSPASVGSTASTSSSGGVSTTHDSSSGCSVTLPRHIFNKAAEHLAVSTLINTCLELWRLSESYMEQCRGELMSANFIVAFIFFLAEFFINADRKASLTVHYYRLVVIVP